MSIAVTRAAIEMEERSEEISPYEVISLLLDGALERIDQAKQSLSCGETEATGILIDKAVGIVNGLRGSLDMEKGGEIAQNLDGLYEYINNRLCEAEVDTGSAILLEAGKLLSEVKNGWDDMAAA